MDNVGDDEPDPIRLKSIKNNKTFTVPQSDRVRNNQPAIPVVDKATCDSRVTTKLDNVNVRFELMHTLHTVQAMLFVAHRLGSSNQGHHQLILSSDPSFLTQLRPSHNLTFTLKLVDFCPQVGALTWALSG